MDVVIPYRSAPGDLELRYALRSLVNLPHDRVIIAGDRPQIIGDGVLHVPVDPIPDRYQSSTANILAACEASNADQVVVTHDDTFIMRPWVFRHEDRGSLAGYLASGRAAGGYRVALEATLDILTGLGVQDPLFFGMHSPTVYDRVRLTEVIHEFRGRSVSIRTLYHNLHPAPSVTREDVKLHRWMMPRSIPDVLSISDNVAANIGFREWIARQFPDRSPYERSGRCLILGYGPTVWADLEARWGEFSAVIASPEAAEHWPGDILAVANDDIHARTIAESYGFDDVVICGATEVAR